jgi:arylsulfatase A-like enzyme
LRYVSLTEYWDWETLQLMPTFSALQTIGANMKVKVETSLLAIIAFLASIPCSIHAYADAYRAKPKLVVILVIDQFREDYLERYRSDFKTPNGFNLFLKRGANFTDCYFGYANTMTAPGHATIGTGAYTNGHGISLNDWWDLTRSTTYPVTSVEDEHYLTVGSDNPKETGASPRNELASTLGDEVVLATKGESKLFGISLKDRAAILTSGHASQGAFWLDHATGHFVSSTYWGPDLPQWVKAFNSSGRAEIALREAAAKPGNFYNDVGKSPASVSYLLDFAKSLVSAEHMGGHDVTDVLTISISSTDILGHIVGPDAPEQRAMVDAIDVDLDNFFSWLNQHVDGGMSNVWVALTADHGIAPTVKAASDYGMPAASFDTARLVATLNTRLNGRFSPGQQLKYILPSELPYVTLDPRAFALAKVSEEDAENAAAKMLPEDLESTLLPLSVEPSQTRLAPQPYIRHVYTRLQMASGQVPSTEEGQIVLHSYSSNGGWYVLVTPGMYELSQDHGTNHFTPYSYDRHVPLAFFGTPFKPATYHGRVAPVDLAATLASLLRVNQPSASVGQVLTQAIDPRFDSVQDSPDPRRVGKK